MIFPAHSASITLKRVDGMPFDLASFTGQILSNTAGAGASVNLIGTNYQADISPLTAKAFFRLVY